MGNKPFSVSVVYKAEETNKRRNDIMNCHIRMSTSFVIALIALFIVIKLCFLIIESGGNIIIIFYIGE